MEGTNREGEAISIFRLREMKRLGQGHLAFGCGVTAKTGVLELQGTHSFFCGRYQKKPGRRPSCLPSAWPRHTPPPRHADRTFSRKCLGPWDFSSWCTSLVASGHVGSQFPDLG